MEEIRSLVNKCGTTQPQLKPMPFSGRGDTVQYSKLCAAAAVTFRVGRTSPIQGGQRWAGATGASSGELFPTMNRNRKHRNLLFTSPQTISLQRFIRHILHLRLFKHRAEI